MSLENPCLEFQWRNRNTLPALILSVYTEHNCDFPCDMRFSVQSVEEAGDQGRSPTSKPRENELWGCSSRCRYARGCISLANGLGKHLWPVRIGGSKEQSLKFILSANRLSAACFYFCHLHLCNPCHWSWASGLGLDFVNLSNLLWTFT